MTSRIAIIALLATGALMGSAGAALGASALSTDTSASALQYGQGKQDVALAGSGGPSAGGPGAGSTPPAGTKPGVAGVRSDTPPAAAQAPRQLEASSADTLPFTGYAAIPLLLIGLALLTCGLVLRRRTGRESSSLSAA